MRTEFKKSEVEHKEVEQWLTETKPAEWKESENIPTAARMTNQTTNEWRAGKKWNVCQLTCSFRPTRPQQSCLPVVLTVPTSSLNTPVNNFTFTSPGRTKLLLCFLWPLPPCLLPPAETMVTIWSLFSNWLIYYLMHLFILTQHFSKC